MATTFNRICLDDHEIHDGEKVLRLKRGQEYTTGHEQPDGKVMVFSTYWALVPVEWFAGEKVFTAS